MRRIRLSPAVAFVALVLLSNGAAARETGALHDREDDPDDVSSLEEEAFGTRGLLRTRAEQVSFDARERSLELSGNVRVDAPPFHLRSQHIKLSRTAWGIEADGLGRLAFCPCLGTPVTIEFDKAIVAPPGELFLKNPKLEIYGVPVMYLPWFWMRSDEKIGVLPPEVAYRAQDGLFLGEGVHLPWKDRGARQALDLRGGAYFKGGFVADARLRSPIASTKIRYDRLPSSTASAPTLPLVAGPNADTKRDDGLFVDARGASQQTGETTIAWDVDVVRGRRGVAATTDLDTAARPYDRAGMTGALRLGRIITETGARAVTRRGGDLVALDAVGPFAAVRSSGGTSGLTYDATFEGGAVRVSGAAASLSALATPNQVPDTVTYGRAEIGLLGASTLGPFAASISGRAGGDVAAEGRRNGADRTAAARVRVGVPVARSFAITSADNPDDQSTRTDPIVHMIEPFLEAAALHTKGDQILGTLPGRGLASVNGTAPVALGGFTTALGRWGHHDALELTAAGGAAFGSNVTTSGVRPLVRTRLSMTETFVGAQVDTAHVISTDEQTPFERSGADKRGDVVVARVRLGKPQGVHVLTNLATRDGLDPILARALTSAAIEAPAGFLAREGTTGGASLVIPWVRAITTSLGADGDATNQELVAARTGVELRDRCNCLTLRANASHRIGRDGVDVWLALDFAADR